MSIPKTIHYCWFGGKELPSRVLRCIASWKSNLPDYEIKEWNETNVSIDNKFVKKCYSLQKWAFVSDYVRLKVLFNEGGVYLDTDMLVLKSLSFFLKHKFFIGSESSEYINCAIIGAEKKNNFLFECLKLYDYLEVPSDNRWYKIAIPVLVTKKFREFYKFEESFDDIIDFFDIKVYPKSFFYSVPNLKREINELDIQKYTTENSYTVHLWEGSWMEMSEFALIKNRQYFKSISKIFKTIFFYRGASIKYFKKIVKTFIHSLKN